VHLWIDTDIATNVDDAVALLRRGASLGRNLAHLALSTLMALTPIDVVAPECH
jgi:hypothetical protein